VSLGLENLGMLLGLGALAIPLLIHFLQRRRYDVVDWGAMQFLQVAPSVRRRWWWDELLLLLIRMGMLAVLVLALASPFVEGPLVRELPGQPRRDVVFVLDPSASMSRGETWAKAKEWVRTSLAEMRAGDRAALVLAGQPAREATELTSDLVVVDETVKALPEPGGMSDLPHALEIARDLLAASDAKAGTHIYLLSDQRRNGWTDERTMASWERISASGFGKDGPKLSLVRLGEAAKTEPLNFWLGPMQANLSVVAPGRLVAVTTTLHWQGEGALPAEAELIARVDGTEVKRWSVSLSGAKSPVPLTFTVKLDEAGSRLVSLEVATKDDVLKQDNERHLVLEAVEGLPILLVNGDATLTNESSTYFLNNALRGDDKGRGLFAVRRIPYSALSREALFEGNRNRARVVILADLPTLSNEQSQAIEQFLRQGGGLLVGLGPRSAKNITTYQKLHQEGLGWLSVHLEGAEGEEKKLEQAARIVGSGPPHPALDYFRDPVRGLNQARFPRWMKMTPGEGATAIGFLDVGEAFLVESKFAAGRVIVSALPLDRSWGSDFPSLHAYPILVHRLLLYLAEAGNAGHVLQPGQRVTWQPDSRERVALPASLYWQERGGEARAYTVERWPWIGPEMRKPGPASLTWGVGKKAWFVVPWDERESDLTRASEEEEATLARLIPWSVVDRPGDVGAAGDDARPDSVDIWWLLLLGVVFFLCLEIWFTRKIAKQQVLS